MSCGGVSKACLRYAWKGKKEGFPCVIARKASCGLAAQGPAWQRGKLRAKFLQDVTLGLPRRFAGKYFVFSQQILPRNDTSCVSAAGQKQVFFDPLFSKKSGDFPREKPVSRPFLERKGHKEL
ncbi:MAG: hypothetical protein Q4B50_03775 [Bacillota bacterium]|nr:hypothetical protein [Bacillota bacterium]